MSRTAETLLAALAALAPVIWGTTYLVATQLLPDGYPLTAAFLRALPAGVLLLALAPRLPPRALLGRLLVLGALNLTLFWSALFVAAYRLPGGVAAMLGAVQPLIVLILARLVMAAPMTPLRLAAAVAGILGVALLVLGPSARLDPVGIGAALVGAVSMAVGVVLTHVWRPPVPALTFTAWQLVAGGLLLLPLALWAEPPLPPLSGAHAAGFVWPGLFGGAISYALWFRGVEKLGPAGVTSLGFLSPLTAVLLGWLVLGQGLTPLQMAGVVIILASVRAGTRPAAIGKTENTPGR